MNLPGVRVSVDSFAVEAQRDGLFPSQLHTDVESKLRQAGIRVIISNEARQTSSVPSLNLRVNLANREGGGYLFHVQLVLLEAVRLKDKPPQQTALAATWSTDGIFGITPPEAAHMADQVRGIVRNETDHFVNAYLAANPRRGR